MGWKGEPPGGIEGRVWREVAWWYSPGGRYCCQSNGDNIRRPGDGAGTGMKGEAPWLTWDVALEARAGRGTGRMQDLLGVGFVYVVLHSGYQLG